VEVAAIVVGCVAQAAAWWVIAAGASVWRVVPPVFLACGALGALVGDATLVDNPSLPGAGAAASWAVTFGLGSGIALYAGTRIFTWLAARWPPFRRDTVASYRRASTLPLVTALGLTALAVVGEELFWRGLVQVRLTETSGEGQLSIGPPLMTAGLYVLVNLPSRSLAIVAASIVGGLLWALLAAITGSIVTPALSHLVWTSLMLAFPPRAGREMMPA